MKIKVAYLSRASRSHRSGNHTFHHDLILPYLRDLGHEVTLVTADHENFEEQTEIPTITIHGTNPEKFSLRLLRGFRRAVLSQNFDLVIASSWSGLLLARKKGPRVIHFLHNSWSTIQVQSIRLEKNGGFRSLALRAIDFTAWKLRAFLLISKSPDIVFPSAYTQNAFENDIRWLRRLFPRTSMRVAYNPVLDAEGNSNFVDNHLGQYSHTFNIGYLGRISPQKGIRHLVLLMRELGADASMPISLHIAGPVQDEDYFRIVEDEVKSFNQAAGPLSICICGPVPSGQAVAFYRKMNLAIFPSLCHEGFSLSVLEAMVAQTPIVAYRSGGTAEALEFGKLGILVNRGEVSELVEATRQLLRDAQAASQMAVEAREAALKKYTLAAHVTSLLRS